MAKNSSFTYEIQYTKAADKFFKAHEAVRMEYKEVLKELLVGEHPEKVDVKRIKGKKNDYYRIRLGACRVIYTVINGKVVVIKTILAGTRGDVLQEDGWLKIVHNCN